MVQEAQLEAISLFEFQRARLSLSIVVSVKGASFSRIAAFKLRNVEKFTPIIFGAAKDFPSHFR
jgi:hypothetical protein